MQKRECITLNTSKPATESYLRSTHASLFSVISVQKTNAIMRAICSSCIGALVNVSFLHISTLITFLILGTEQHQWCTCFGKKGVNLAIPLSTYSQNLSDLCDQSCDWAEGGGITGWSPDQVSLQGVSPVIRLHSNSSSLQCTARHGSPELQHRWRLCVCRCMCQMKPIESLSKDLTEEQ